MQCAPIMGTGCPAAQDPVFQLSPDSTIAVAVYSPSYSLRLASFIGQIGGRNSKCCSLGWHERGCLRQRGTDLTSRHKNPGYVDFVWIGVSVGMDAWERPFCTWQHVDWMWWRISEMTCGWLCWVGTGRHQHCQKMTCGLGLGWLARAA